MAKLLLTIIIVGFTFTVNSQQNAKDNSLSKYSYLLKETLDSKTVGWATGFLVKTKHSNYLLISNYHVLDAYDLYKDSPINKNFDQIWLRYYDKKENRNKFFLVKSRNYKSKTKEKISSSNHPDIEYCLLKTLPFSMEKNSIENYIYNFPIDTKSISRT